MNSSRISPTAHYTSYVWTRHGLSHPDLQTAEGRLLYESLRAPMALSQVLGGNSLERYLLARHRSIDLLLERGIESGEIGQVLEIACGLSPRGWRLHQRYGDRVPYVEADLPAMAAAKRRALARFESPSPHHLVVDLDALAPSGPMSLEAVVDQALDPERGTAIITEGLLGYLDSEQVASLWERVAATLHRFPAGRYISDLHLGSVQDPPILVFRLVLSAFVRGRVHLHFDTATEAEEALRSAGFDAASVRHADELTGRQGEAGAQLVHIIEASTDPD